MKRISILLIAITSILFHESCIKQEIVDMTPTSCQDSIVLNFETYKKGVVPPDIYIKHFCPKSSIETLTIYCDSIISDSYGHRDTLSAVGDFYYSRSVDKSYQVMYSEEELFYYPCNDSIKRTFIDHYFQYGDVTYSKAVNPSTSCPGHNSKYCDVGMADRICFTSPYQNYNEVVMNNAKYDYTLDTINDQAVIKLQENGIYLSFTIPLNNNVIQLGEYWIGTVPSGGKEIIDVHYFDQHQVSPFSYGYFKVSSYNNAYMFSIRIGCEGTVWSGRVRNPV